MRMMSLYFQPTHINSRVPQNRDVWVYGYIDVSTIAAILKHPSFENEPASLIVYHSGRTIMVRYNQDVFIRMLKTERDEESPGFAEFTFTS